MIKAIRVHLHFACVRFRHLSTDFIIASGVCLQDDFQQKKERAHTGWRNPGDALEGKNGRNHGQRPTTRFAAQNAAVCRESLLNIENNS